MYEEVSYRKPFLKEVVARVDFSAPVEALNSSVPPSIANIALRRFPIVEERKAFAQELQFSPGELHHKREEFIEWNYHGSEREKRLAIAPGFAYVTYSQYTSFECLKEDFVQVMEALFSKYSDLRARRVGLRYINTIEIRDQNPHDWTRLIDGRLLGLFSRFEDQREYVTRLFSIAEFKCDDDIKLKFQFGVPNPDYPARVRKPQFVIDIDGYSDGLQELRDLSANIDSAHARIQDLFEQSITEDLRGVMNG